jgi:hypothetical protein
MELPQDLKSWRPSEEEADAFQILSGEAAVYLMCVVAFFVFAMRGYL